jgi:hypothetical protein
MTQKIRGVVFVSLIPLALMMGCKDDEIPSALTGPFLVSDLVIGQKPSPPVNSTLSIGQTVTFSVDMAYTLSAPDAHMLDSLYLAYGLIALNAGLDTVYGHIGPAFPLQFIPLTATSGAVSVAPQITLPDPGFTYTINFFAFIQVGDTTNITFLKNQSQNEITGNAYWLAR